MIVIMKYANGKWKRFLLPTYFDLYLYTIATWNQERPDDGPGCRKKDMWVEYYLFSLIFRQMSFNHHNSCYDPRCNYQGMIYLPIYLHVLPGKQSTLFVPASFMQFLLGWHTDPPPITWRLVTSTLSDAWRKMRIMGLLGSLPIDLPWPAPNWTTSSKTMNTNFPGIVFLYQVLLKNWGGIWKSFQISLSNFSQGRQLRNIWYAL